jgi:hypothetical protein
MLVTTFGEGAVDVPRVGSLIIHRIARIRNIVRRFDEGGQSKCWATAVVKGGPIDMDKLANDAGNGPTSPQSIRHVLPWVSTKKLLMCGSA